MHRVVVLLLICMLMLSHGGMSAAAPHGDHHEANGEIVDDHDRHSSSPDPGEPASDVGHATHVHVVASLPDSQMFDAAALTGAGRSMRPLLVDELASRGVAPLLEPPSA